MKLNQQTQKAKAILQSIGKVTPIYLMRMPHGKRLLQIQNALEKTNADISAAQLADTAAELATVTIKNDVS